MLTGWLRECDAYWQSDVNAGRLVGSAAVAKLHSNATFLAQMAAAKVEIAEAREKASKQKPDAAQIARCEVESTAIASEKSSGIAK